MPATIDTAAAAELHEHGAVFIEVLPAEEYRRAHVPGARNIPLTEMTAEAVASLDPGATTITYCHDFQCDLSSRAAARLEHLGFADARDYVASKMAWMAAGLPVEGSSDAEAHAASVADPAVPTCPPTATVGEIRAKVKGWPIAVVIDDERVVLGAIAADALDVVDTTPVEAVLEPGPSTVRPSISTRELADNLDDDGVGHVLVTTNAGVLIGLVRRDDLGDER